MSDIFNAPAQPQQHESAFEGMDEASLDRGGKLTPFSKSRVRITNFIVKRDDPKFGTSAIFEFNIVQSSDPSLTPNSRAGIAFHKITEKGPDGKPSGAAKFKQAMIKGIVAAAFKVDPKLPQKWGDITDGLELNPSLITGRELVIEMGKESANRNGAYVEKKGFYPV